MRIVLAGATGLVGGFVLDRLLAHPAAPSVQVVTRRPTGRSHARLTEQVADVADWPSLITAGAADVGISTLGTTIRAAGSRAAFAAVDRDAVLAEARAARSAGSTHFLTVSSVGADAASANFYLRTKGETEAALKQLSFARLDIFRPGLLRGPRRDFRLGERIGQAAQFLLDPLLIGSLSKYRSIAADQVARALVASAMKTEPGHHVHHHDEMMGC
jgi:uncharacterized protein YbjT (DUF2867 family)